MKFKDWKEIRDWANDLGFKHLARRLEVNWANQFSSGEYTRSQKRICDAIRFSKGKEQVEIAKEIDIVCQSDPEVDLSLPAPEKQLDNVAYI